MFSYRLDPIVINGRIKEAMTELKATHPEIKATIMGTRRTDPHSSKSKCSFTLSDFSKREACDFLFSSMDSGFFNSIIHNE